MYQENKSINYIKIILRIVLFLLIVVLTVKLVTMIFNRRKSSIEKDVMNSNLAKMQEVAVKYYNDGNVKIKVGETAKYTLQ